MRKPLKVDNFRNVYDKIITTKNSLLILSDLQQNKNHQK